MSRRRRAVKRPIARDPNYNSPLVTRLVNTVMKCGKKSTAQRIVYGAFAQIAEKNTGANPLDILQRAVDNPKPRIETKARRVGGATSARGASKVKSQNSRPAARGHAARSSGRDRFRRSGDENNDRVNTTADRLGMR